METQGMGAQVVDARRILSMPVLAAGVAASVLLGLPAGWALVLGSVLAWVMGNPHIQATVALSHAGTKLSMVLMGFGVGMGELTGVGSAALLPVALTVASTLAAGVVLGRVLGVERIQAVLIAGGTAICGGSAVAALSGSLRAEARSTGTALAVIFGLNAAALVLFPLAGAHLGMDAQSFGMWSGLAIHDTSSVAGAAAAFGGEALSSALPVKMVRILFLLPVCLLAPVLLGGKAGPAPRPLFLVGFVAAALIAWLAPAQRALWDGFAACGKGLLPGAVFLVGAGIRPRDLVEAGWKPAALGAGLWLFVTGATLWWVLR